MKLKEYLKSRRKWNRNVNRFYGVMYSLGFMYMGRIGKSKVGKKLGNR